MNSQAPVFIVGTGRCGSTALSNMLRLHPAVLSLSELLTFLRPYTLAYDRLDGVQFWRVLSEPRTMHMVLLRHGLTVEEFLYPRLAARPHWTDQGIPPILLTTLPHLTDDPDGLFDELGRVVRAWPEDTLATQYLRLFAWLSARLERQIWIERSGVSLDLVPQLIRHFPDAKFVHLYRDGRDCAESMSRHHYFRLAVIGRQLAQVVGSDPYESVESPVIAEAPPQVRVLLPETFAVAAYQAVEIPPSRFGAIWSALIAKGLAHLAQLPAERVLSIQYEALVASPRAELRRLMEFVQPELTTDRWLDEATALIRTKASAWPALPEQERRLLQMACRPGEQLLRQAEGGGVQSVPLTPESLDEWLCHYKLPQI
jgi:putative sulfotransferase